MGARAQFFQQCFISIFSFYFERDIFVSLNVSFILARTDNCNKEVVSFVFCCFSFDTTVLDELFWVQQVSEGNLRALLSKVNETLHCLKFPTIALKLLQP